MQILDNNIHTKLEIIQRDICSVRNFYDLQLFLKTPGGALQDYINNPGYISFFIPKKKGGNRQIQSPNGDLLRIQRRLNYYYFQPLYLLNKPEAVHGFINKPKGYETSHSIISNAAPHVNKKHVLNIDLKDFFPSISAQKVRNIVIQHLGFNDSQIADAIALLCTYQKSLPIGAPTSPVLANFACLEMDRELSEYCVTYGINYTRYADDLTFSSVEYLTDTIISSLRLIIEKHEFTINEKKFRLLSSKSKQTVTGIVVNEKLNVDRTYIRNIRATLNHVKTKGLEEAAKKHYKAAAADQFSQHKLLFKLRGQIDFVGQVRGKQDEVYLKLKKIAEISIPLITK